MCRHFHAKVILSSQYAIDNTTIARANCSWWIWGGIDPDKLKDIFKAIGFRGTFKKFLKRYYHATKEPHAFLDINVRSKRMRASTEREYVSLDAIESQ